MCEIISKPKYLKPFIQLTNESHKNILNKKWQFQIKFSKL